MTDWRYLPNAIASQYGNVADTVCTESSGQITAWRHASIAQPSQATLKSLIDAYELKVAKQPNWAGFRQAIVVLPAYLKVAAAHNTNVTLNSSLVWVLGQLSTDPAIASEAVSLWNNMVSRLLVGLLPTEIAQLNAIATANNIPFSLNSSGQMVAN